MASKIHVEKTSRVEAPGCEPGGAACLLFDATTRLRPCAVATSREGRRSPRSGQAVRRRLVARNDATDVLSAIVAGVAHKVLTLARNQESYLHIAVALGAFGTGLCFIEQHGHHHLRAGP
jgi:hypothetical protein